MTLHDRSSRWWLTGVAIVVATTALVWAWPRIRPLPSEPLRIGFEYDPPFHYRGDDGRPHGLAVDIVNEAARRIGLKLQWIHFPKAPWTVVRDGQTDLWPLLAILPDRKGFVHISAPYLAADFNLLFLEGTPMPGPDYNGQVGLQRSPVSDRFLKRGLPKATGLEFHTSANVVEAVCRGEVPVGLVSIGGAAAALPLNTTNCKAPLRAVKLQNLSIQLGVGARVGYGWVADRLRREIDRMSRDGTLSAVLMPYSMSNTVEVVNALEMADARARERAFALGLGLVATALLLVTVLSVLLVRANRKALSAVAAQRELEARLLQREHLESVGRLAGGIAHDFNNVMTVIAGYCEMLLADVPVAGLQRNALEEMQKSAARATGLVQQLLAFSRRQIVHPRRVSAHAELSAASQMLQRLVGEGIKLVVSKEPGDDEIVIDPGQLQQVAVNLAMNARDAMPEGGRLVFTSGPVSLDARDAGALELSPGSYVRLRVSDTGTGMDEQTRRHAFEPFYTTKPFGAGSGLGLATVYGTVKQAGGAASITSTPGNGATLELFFPVPVSPPAGAATNQPRRERIEARESRSS